ncbi:MAG TPA: tetraacyldisaccharide 4'-kinase [Sedimentisphaerales bacterium]|nr:tetraacyldisaccharide 4'-kinase [Sedimentisphaerales bacterium]
MNQQDYRKLVSGQATGLGSSLLRLLLGIAACGYSLVIRLRNLLYSKGWFKTHRVNAAVISIGNITTGGTGKTPLVAWLCNEITQNSKLKTQNCKCAILTRGYKATQNSKLKTQNYFDEPAILAQSCPQAKVVVNPDRVAGAVNAISFGANVLIMDDGFQHRRLARDLDIVAIDATMPFGFGRILPAGLLREPITALRRAGAVVITRADQAAQDQLTEIENKIRNIKADIVIARSIHSPVCAISRDGDRISLEKLQGKKILAFCGIGNPGAFLNTLKALGADLLGSAVFDDHHHYTHACLEKISKQARHLKADLIVTTQKDWTKIAPLLTDEKHLSFAFLAVEIRFQTGQDRLKGLIEHAIAGRICARQMR